MHARCLLFKLCSIDHRLKYYGATPPSFTVQPYVPVNVARAATADALYFVVPMLNVTPDCNV
jgi:hypothetical protein